MGLLDRISAAVEKRFNIDAWISDYLVPANEFNYNNHVYPLGLNQTMVADRTKEISTTLPGYMAALRACPPAFAAQMVRALVLSQARFVFRNNRISRNPGRLFGTSALAPLEKPWPNATTGELLARMEWHAGLAGNAFVTTRTQGRLRVLRPDWVMIVYGSQQEPEDAAQALDGEVIGYVYCNGGIAQNRNDMHTLLPDEVAHWSPLPDPENAGIGMSWITPAIRDIQGDRAATDHKLRFFENGATPNMVVKGITAVNSDQFNQIVDMMESKHAGVRNAYKTLYLAAGADATVVGSNLQQLDFKNTQGAGETRISMLSRVHPVILGASEGLAGSSLNAGNFGAARRMWADSWIYPTLQDVAAALAPLIRVPGDAELWTTTTDMPILREDAKDAAEIEATKASTINTLITAGFTPDSSVSAVDVGDMKLLVHSGMVSVQLQPPGEPPPGGSGEPPGKAPPPSNGGPTRSVELDDDSEALFIALAEFEAEHEERAFNPKLHLHYPKGHPQGGQFRPMIDLLKDALKEHHASGGKGGDPFELFNREQLRRVAVKRGITLKHGASREDIAAALLADLYNPATLGVKEAPALHAFVQQPPKKAVKKAAKKVAPATSKVAELPPPPYTADPNVLLEHFQGGPHPGKAASLRVSYAGMHIGAVHQSFPTGSADGSSTSKGSWTATGLGSQNVSVPSGASRDEAIKALIDNHANNPYVPPAKKKAAKKIPPPPLSAPVSPVSQLPISHIPEDVQKLLFSSYKAQPKGQLISSPTADTYDNLFAVAHVYGHRVPSGLTVGHVAEVVDAQLAKNQGISNSHLLMKKLTTWLGSSEGAAYVKAHKEPKPSIVAALTGKVTLPEGVHLAPGEKVQKVSGPGAYDPHKPATDFIPHTASQMQDLQAKYRANHGIVLTPDQHAALKNYTGGGYSGMNGYLRGAYEYAGPQVKDQVLQVQSAMMPIQQDTLLIRGTGWEQLPKQFHSPELAKKLVGKTIEDPGFMSTAVAGSGGEFPGNVHLTIEAPAGTPGVFVRELSLHKGENEMLLAAGTRFRVISVESTSMYTIAMRLRVVTAK